MKKLVESKIIGSKKFDAINNLNISFIKEDKIDEFVEAQETFYIVKDVLPKLKKRLARKIKAIEKRHEEIEEIKNKALKSASATLTSEQEKQITIFIGEIEKLKEDIGIIKSKIDIIDEWKEENKERIASLENGLENASPQEKRLFNLVSWVCGLNPDFSKDIKGKKGDNVIKSDFFEMVKGIVSTAFQYAQYHISINNGSTKFDTEKDKKLYIAFKEAYEKTVKAQYCITATQAKSNMWFKECTFRVNQQETIALINVLGSAKFNLLATKIGDTVDITCQDEIDTLQGIGLMLIGKMQGVKFDKTPKTTK